MQFDREQSRYLSFGINLTAGFIFFTFFGHWVDSKIGKGQAWTLAGMFMGLFYCGYETWKLVKKLNKSDKP